MEPLFWHKPGCGYLTYKGCTCGYREQEERQEAKRKRVRRVMDLLTILWSAATLVATAVIAYKVLDILKANGVKGL